MKLNENDFSLIGAISKAVSNIDWKKPQAVIRARRIARSKANKIATAIRSNATRKNIPVETYCRNVIVMSEPDDIKTWAAFLSYMVLNRKRGFTGLKSAADLLTEDKRNQGLLLTLLSSETKPSNAEIVRFYSNQPERALVFLITSFNSRYSNTSKDLSKRLAYIYRTQKDLKETIESNILAQIWKKHKLSRLDCDSIFIMPESLQQKLLNSFEAATTILSSNCITQVFENPRLCSLSPPGRLLSGDSQLQHAIKTKMWSDSSLTALFLLYQTEGTENLILQNLRSGNGTKHCSGGERILENLKSIQNAHLAQAIKFTALDSDERLKYFFSLRVKDRIRLVENTSFGDWAMSLVEISHENDFSNIIRKLSKYNILQDVLPEYFSLHIRHRSIDIDRSALVELVRMVQFDTYFKEVQTHPDRYFDIFFEGNRRFELVKYIIYYCHTPEKLAEFIKRSCSFEKSPFKPEKLLETFSNYYPIKTIDWLADLYKSASTLPDLQDLIVKTLFKSAPQHIIKIIKSGKNETTFLRIFQLMPAKHSRKCDALLGLKGNDGLFLWEPLLQKLETVSIPKSLKAAIENGKIPILTRAFQIQPQFFLRAAVNRLGLKVTLPLAFKNPSLGLYIDRTVEREILRKHIPWVRKKWAAKPTVKTAYETALSFSVADAPYLLFLATKRGYQQKHYKLGNAFDEFYQSYKLPKKSGGNRLISIPDNKLKRLQRRVLKTGLEEISIHKNAHGFLKKRSIVTNAKPHTGHEMVINLDISGFFPNTRYPAILKACRKLAGGHLSYGAVRFVADICSYNGSLPAGAPTSPHISNIILQPADKSLAKVAKKNGIIYTRYADDLTFSGGPKTKLIIPFVRKVMADAGYALDPKKLNIFRRGRRQIVTGLVVNQKPNIPRYTRKKIRAAVHHVCSGKAPKWHGREMSIDELMGRLAYLKIVQPKEARKYKSMVKKSLSHRKEAS